MPLSTLLCDLEIIIKTGAHPPDSARDSARRIIAEITGMSRADQITSPDTAIAPEHAARARDIAARHGAGAPLSRIFGVRGFYGLDFALSPDTLDPRPETEIIVDTVLKWIHTHPSPFFPAPAPHPNPLPVKHGERGQIVSAHFTLLDLGTGTGCIPIAILKNAPHIRAVATDIAPGALKTARANAVTHGVADRMTLIESDWYHNIPPQKFDIITSNPPYIDPDILRTLDINVRDYDPIRALDGGAGGLAPYEILIAGLETYLMPGGMALFEIGVGQAADITRLGVKYGLDVAPPIVDDAQIPRVIYMTRPIKNKVDSGA